MDKIIVGSRAFFSGMEGFKSKDRDFLELVDEPKGFEWRQEMSLRGVDTFRYRKESPAQMVQRTINAGDPLLIGKFLVPEVAEAIGATVADILPLEQLLPQLDDKHRYVALIFDAVKENNSFTLTAEQRATAFAAYQEARPASPRMRTRPKRSDDDTAPAAAETSSPDTPEATLPSAQ